MESRRPRQAAVMEEYKRRFGALPGNVLVYFKFREKAEAMIEEVLTGVAPDWTSMGGAETFEVY